MFQSNDGSKHGSRFVARKKDEIHALGQSAAQEHAEPEAEEMKETPAEEKAEVENPQELVKKHGMAHTIHVKHNHVANKHHVTSQHEDGHTHESDHESADIAHKHASQLAGVPPMEQKPSAEESLEAGGEQMGAVSPHQGLA